MSASSAPLGQGLFAEVVAALLDFEKAPGRYPVALRQPEAVFEHLRNVLQIAVGRAPETASLPPGRASMAQRAARFFVRTVMLRPGSDHFTLLGLTQGFEPDELRDHYRMMIRLTHPDFTASGEAWPADAASRINIANDVLSSPVKRGDYLRRTAASNMAAPLQPRPLRRMPSVRRIAAQRAAASAFRSRAARFGLLAIGVLAVAGALLLLRSGPDDGSLTVAARNPAEAPPEAPPGAAPGAQADAQSAQQTVPQTVPQTATQTNIPVSAPSPGQPKLVAPDLSAPALTATVPSATVQNKAVPAAAVSTPSVQTASLRPASGPTAPDAAALPVESAAPSTAQSTPPAPRPRRIRPAAPAEAFAAQTALPAAGAPALAPAAPAPAAQAPQAATLTAAAVPAAAALPAPAAAPEPARAAAPAQAAAPSAAAAAATAAATATTAAATSPATPSPSPAPTVAATPATPEPIVSGLQLTDVQPTLTRVVESLQTGRGPAVVRWVDPALRNSTANQRFVNSYHFALGGRRVVQLQRADFTARDQPGELVVTGQIELLLEDPQGSMVPRKLQVRAHFTPRDGKPVLTHLVNIPAQRNP